MDAIESTLFDTTPALRTRWICLLASAATAVRVERSGSSTGADLDAAHAALDRAMLALASAPIRTREDMRVLARAVRDAESLTVGEDASRALLNALLIATIEGP
ncbi:conserved protein of unknown function [Rhodovastum atsumiense]|uniref:Uncharacterized protein n=1 Tax=Rhodovastum atsumiense TaxID=504468 RepID=A0A5M6IP67_9PROT|nr:hypothetical protein [Rhodovastum atsumiense]KAA5610060.1 hypothetical protein F1189_21395 [Rhodovastum atsumiense]CAH2602942.1 conserved protein of unknown function [Rhodovastum atsumiense]